MRRRTVPAPERVTAADVVRALMGLVMIPLGVTILVRTLSIAPTVPGVLVGCAFVAFGVHRLWTAWVGYRLYRRNRGSAS
ncbi:MAG: hypothetical protein K6V36_12900 [Anaerolineae bacterium]|nr:hypothetical protein [Anaerolineae bacterium]